MINHIMKFFLYLFTLLLIISYSINAIAKENWEFIKESEYCFIQSNPVKTDIPEGKSRGAHGILVVKMHKNPNLFVQISSGFNFKSSSSIDVTIDQISYNFVADEDTAWATNDEVDKKTIYAMKKGLKLTTIAVSSKGTKVIDTYTLEGFTAAFNKLSNDC